jgi:hypothetical protein
MTSASASRVTRSSRNLRRAVALFLGVLSMATVLWAQERTPAPAPQPEAADAPRDAAPAGTAATRPDTDAPAPATDAPASRGGSPTRFEPTEKVRADFDVSFPIDI